MARAVFISPLENPAFAKGSLPGPQSPFRRSGALSGGHTHHKSTGGCWQDHRNSGARSHHPGQRASLFLRRRWDARILTTFPDGVMNTENPTNTIIIHTQSKVSSPVVFSVSGLTFLDSPPFLRGNGNASRSPRAKQRVLFP